jgi:pilus assembly protein Flp/PilA
VVADMCALKCFLFREDGVTAIEYALVASLIAIVILGTITLLGTNVKGLYDTIAAAF